MTSAIHPWRELQGLPEWACRFVDLPDGVLGATDHDRQVIFLARGMSQAQRRSTLAHELRHVTRPAEREHCVDQVACARLIPLDRLIDALRWCLDKRELADELWVDLATVETRLASLSENEQATIEEALDDPIYE